MSQCGMSWMGALLHALEKHGVEAVNAALEEDIQRMRAEKDARGKK